MNMSCVGIDSGRRRLEPLFSLSFFLLLSFLSRSRCSRRDGITRRMTNVKGCPAWPWRAPWPGLSKRAVRWVAARVVVFDRSSGPTEVPREHY